ncbi:hypothetical protein COY05_03825 [Candidatus Peregrinibacteria bacterium CG_4_10_14_0_2_um_filter_38_24]|nr:MAG: hypothetical protein COY05_03825 [Candidatus Peregrinibacteria bacterium CG_4_10_14_0_2_um_filter_38_24]PJC38719.1 MAG: hypothetical protein CO044_03510 [Candidatus Peregrinibacteria bacterium CG_4_9_14_0_2_um_filter_38_9]
MKAQKLQFRKYVAEMFGAFILASIVAISIMSHTPVPTQVLAGLTLGTFVYILGGISGAHLNPAVTIAMASVKKIKPLDALMYVLFQLAGGALAYYFSTHFMGGTTGVESATTDVVLWKIALAEAVGAGILVLGVSTVVAGKVKEDIYGIVIGSALLIGIMLTGGLSFGTLNPAVALGVGVPYTNFVYFLAPIVGGVVAAWFFKVLTK